MPTEKTKKDYSRYFNDLNCHVDNLITIANRDEWDIHSLAMEAGLCEATVRRLFFHTTKFPQWRTMQCIAMALQGRIDFVERKYPKRKKNHKLKIFLTTPIEEKESA